MESAYYRARTTPKSIWKLPSPVTSAVWALVVTIRAGVIVFFDHTLLGNARIDLLDRPIRCPRFEGAQCGCVGVCEYSCHCAPRLELPMRRLGCAMSGGFSCSGRDDLSR